VEESHHRPVALTIAGSDPSGGAGIQADLKVFHQFGVYGEAVITLLTVQNTVSVSRVEVMDARLVEEQIRAVIADIPPAAIKTGALGSAAIVRMIADLAPQFGCPLVVDPVMISTHGAPLIAKEAGAAYIEALFPRATLITPNLAEAGALTRFTVDSIAAMREAARRLSGRSGAAVLIKGGHLLEEPIDVLCDRGELLEFPSPRIATAHTHGTGCTYSAAITALLASGLPLREAVLRAKQYITEAIRTNPGLGTRNGPVNHFACVAE
jgi:hydroxymethylpyrimidine/phosphomethylpyrimidine kinase